MAGSKVMGVVLLLLGIFVCYQGIDLTLGRPSIPGPGLVPFGLGLILTILAAVYLWQNGPKTSSEKSPRGTYRRTVLAVGILCFYGLAMNWIGYLLTTFLAFVLWLSVIEKKNWLQTASLAGLASISVYAFNVLFSIQLPAGLLKGILR
jgi:hypothetical protein